jgi:hypothetical protein
MVGLSVPTTRTGRPSGPSTIWRDHEFAVEGITIVGVGPMFVERVDRRLTWRRVLAAGAVSGSWLGLFVGRC